jgi:hypothetical protein
VILVLAGSANYHGSEQPLGETILMRRLARISAALFVIAYCESRLSATVIPIMNSGFESPVLADGGFVESPFPWSFLETFDSRIFNPTNLQFAGTDGVNGPIPSPGDGSQVMQLTDRAEVGSAGTNNNLALVLPNVIYNLTVAVGAQLDATPSSYEFDIDVNGNYVAFVQGSDAVPGTFHDVSLKWTSPVDVAHDPRGLIGGFVGILLISTSNGTVDFDNVRLTYSAVPEPSCVMLALIGLVCSIALFSRRTQRAADSIAD